jgi:chorismate synthase
MSFNTFGRLFRFTTWGESHGPALGAVVDGCPPGLEISEAAIQPFLDARRPGQSKFTTQRQEPDRCASSPACSKAAPPAPRSA